MYLSSRIGKGKPSDAKVRDYRLQAFSEDLAASGKSAQASKFIFTSFDAGGETQAAAMTLAEAQKEAKAIKARAQAEAAEILAQAAAEKEAAQKIKAGAAEEGRNQGRQTGLAEGTKEGRTAFDAKAAPAAAALAKIQGLYDDLWKLNEATLVKLAVQIAERVIFQEIKTSPELITAAVKAAMEQLNQQHQAVFRINPEDLTLVETAGDKLREQISGLVKISFQSDQSLKRGELVMETESGRLDATLKRRLEAVVGPIDQALQHNFDLDW
ncbi:MAG: FliH/SctL family protein [Pseudomonadota bacterium]